MGGDARDWDIQHKQMESYREKIVQILLSCGVKKSREEILNDIDRDFWLEPQEAIEYGLADAMMTPEIWREWIK
jgi:ATP-dependent Clp protease protease subunit